LCEGLGLLIKHLKTKSSIRVSRVPLWLVEVLRDRDLNMSSVTTVGFGADAVMSPCPSQRILVPTAAKRISPV
jgi:hypothetical protein